MSEFSIDNYIRTKLFLLGYQLVDGEVYESTLATGTILDKISVIGELPKSVVEIYNMLRTHALSVTNFGESLKGGPVTRWFANRAQVKVFKGDQVFDYFPALGDRPSAKDIDNTLKAVIERISHLSETEQEDLLSLNNKKFKELVIASLAVSNKHFIATSQFKIVVDAVCDLDNRANVDAHQIKVVNAVEAYAKSVHNLDIEDKDSYKMLASLVKKIKSKAEKDKEKDLDKDMDKETANLLSAVTIKASLTKMDECEEQVEAKYPTTLEKSHCASIYRSLEQLYKIIYNANKNTYRPKDKNDLQLEDLVTRDGKPRTEPPYIEKFEFIKPTRKSSTKIK